MRPSELVALKVRDVDVKARPLLVRGSRVLWRDGATKTPGSFRSVAIDDETAGLIGMLVPLRTRPDDFLFHAPEGGAIDQGKLGRLFVDAQRVKRIRLRGLYATKDTFCSLYLTNGGRLEWLSAQTGVGQRTLKDHYRSISGAPRTRRRSSRSLPRETRKRGEQRGENRDSLLHELLQQRALAS